MDNNIRLPQLHAGQMYVRKHAKRFNWLPAGRRWRKTSLGMILAVEAMLQGKTAVWGAPVATEVKVGWDEMVKATKGVAKVHIAESYIEIPGMGKTVFRSLDNPDNLRGLTADLLLFDEASYCDGSAWHDVGRPMLMDTNGGAWLFGTPNGKNWFYRGCMRAKTRDNEMLFNAPTLGCRIVDNKLLRVPHPMENPEIKFSEIQDIFDSSPLITFEQEILAEFKDESGGVFRNVEQCVRVGQVENEEPEREHTYFMGVDLARLKDFTVLTVLRDDGRQVFCDRFGQISWALQIDRICDVALRYSPTMVIDATSIGDPLIEQIRNKLIELDSRRADGIIIEPYHLSLQSKTKMIDGLAIDIERGNLSLMDIPSQLQELQDYQYELTNAGNLKMNAPRGHHDDWVIALALADIYRFNYSIPSGTSVSFDGELWNSISTRNGREIWDGYSRYEERGRGMYQNQ